MAKTIAVIETERERQETRQKNALKIQHAYLLANSFEDSAKSPERNRAELNKAVRAIEKITGFELWQKSNNMDFFWKNPKTHEESVLYETRSAALLALRNDTIRWWSSTCLPWTRIRKP